jgi:hypothetical protein
MRKTLFVVIPLVVLLVGLFTLARWQASAQGVAPTPQAETNAMGTRATTPDALVSKVLSNPYCYQPDPSVDQCFINIRYYQATDDGVTPPFLLHVKLSINDKARYNEAAFFENTISYSYDMVSDGIQVPCGAPNAGGGGADFGNLYYVRIDPLDTTGASMGYDQANLLCPAYAP